MTTGGSRHAPRIPFIACSLDCPTRHGADGIGVLFRLFHHERPQRQHHSGQRRQDRTASLPTRTLSSSTRLAVPGYSASPSVAIVHTESGTNGDTGSYTSLIEGTDGNFYGSSSAAARTAMAQCSSSRLPAHIRPSIVSALRNCAPTARGRPPRSFRARMEISTGQPAREAILIP